jgi:acyl-ACP thioesterase
MAEVENFRDSYRVRFYETDPYGRASVRSLLNYLQEAATGDAERLDVAVDYLKENGLAWVMLRIRVEMERWPRGGDRVTVDTWPHAATRVMTERRFRVLDQEGRPLGAATTLWVILDTERRRPVRLPQFALDAIQAVMRTDRPASLEDIPALEEVQTERSFRVRFADLDVARHLNNAAYLQWAAETTPENLWSSHAPHRIDAHYMMECLLGETVDSSSRRLGEDEPAVFLHSLRRRSDGAEVLRARTVWKTTAGV